ncbi:MAG: flagellar basal body rod C-terminal domain-containing protein, partial [Cyanobacteriota bacterium]
SLSLTSTSIKMYEQGAITGTGNITDFAISGEGFFLVEDAAGKRYATRDGQFNFNNEGYLVTSQGLKVLSTGQDYIRNTISNAFIVNGAGVAKSIQGRTVNGTTFNNGSANIYGDRKLMIVQLPNPEKLHYSKYGSTVFDLEDYVPVPIQNTFNEVMDGINPGLMTKVATQRYENAFIHDKTTGTVNVQLNGGPLGLANNSRHALISAHKFTLFATETEFVVPAAGNINFGYSFGQKNSTDTIMDSGYSAGIDPATGNLAIYTYNPVNPLSPNLTSSVALPPFAAGNRIKLTLTVKDGSANIDYTNMTTGTTATTKISVAIGQIENSYHSIGTINDSVASLAATAAAGSIDIHSIANVEISKSVMSGIKILGNQASYFNSNVFTFIPVPAQTVANDILNPENSNIVQSALEESTVSLSDSLPELSLAQKMFSAISKIISVNNNMTDDTNALIR